MYDWTVKTCDPGTPAPTTPAPTGTPAPTTSSLESAAGCLSDLSAACEGLHAPDDLVHCLAGQLLACAEWQTNILDIQEKIARWLEQRKVELNSMIAGFKSQVDASVNNFLWQDKAKITATLESAVSSAVSPDLLQSLLEKALSENLAGNQALMKQVVTASLRNGISTDVLRAAIVAALAGTSSKSAEAVKQLVGFATGTGASVETQKKLLVALEAEAVSKTGDVLSTARAWQGVFNTRDEVVQGTIATLIAASTGSADEDSRIVAAAAFSPTAYKAVGLLLSGYVSQGPLRTALATARIDTRLINDMKNTVSGVYRGGLQPQFNGEKLMMPKGLGKGNAGKLGGLLDQANNIHHGVSGKVHDAKKNVETSTAKVDARNIAGSAAKNARTKAAAAARKAYSG